MTRFVLRRLPRVVLLPEKEACAVQVDVDHVCSRIGPRSLPLGKKLKYFRECICILKRIARKGSKYPHGFFGHQFIERDFLDAIACQGFEGVRSIHHPKIVIFADLLREGL